MSQASSPASCIASASFSSSTVPGPAEAQSGSIDEIQPCMIPLAWGPNMPATTRPPARRVIIRPRRVPLRRANTVSIRARAH